MDAIVRRVEGRRWSPVVGVRLGLAAAVTVLLVAAVAGFGGAGYASIALDKARSAVKDAGSAEQNAARGGQPPRAASHSPGHDQYGPDRVTICHRTPSGREKTLVLPRPAAEAHLRNHEEDTPGPCPA